MLIDSPSPGSDPVLSGPALIKSLAFPPNGHQLENLLSSPLSTCQELLTLHVRPAGPGQAFLVAQAGWGADAAQAAQAAYGEIARVLQDQGLTVVHERLFGSLTVKSAVMASRAAALRAKNLPEDGPITYIQGRPPWGEGFAGAIIQAVSCRNPQDEVWTISHQGKAVGRGWQCQGATFLSLQNIQGLVLGPQGVNTPFIQTHRMLQRAAQLLETQGASYRDVVRTWFYLSDILAWYPEFNRSRTAIYGQFGILPGQGNGRLRLPASTGIRGEVSTGADLFLVPCSCRFLNPLWACGLVSGLPRSSISC